MIISNYQKLALIFPGQGAQSVGMLQSLASKYPEIINLFTAASDYLGYDLWQLVQVGPAEKLNQTEYTQPTLLTAEVALWQIWQKHNLPQPKFLAGHSLGEYSALVCAGVLDFKDAVRLVAKRGQLMQQAVECGRGAMLAIAGLDNKIIVEICAAAKGNEVLAPANYNAIGQTVLSGEKSAIERAVPLAKAAGAKIVKILDVSVPAHSSLMYKAAEALADCLTVITIKTPVLSVISNADVAVYKDAGEILRGLTKQLYSSVRWVETMQFCVQEGVDCFVECGPGKVLCGLNKRIIPDISSLTVESILL